MCLTYILILAKGVNKIIEANHSPRISQVDGKATIWSALTKLGLSKQQQSKKYEFMCSVDLCVRACVCKRRFKISS